MKTIAYLRTASIYDDSRATKEIKALAAEEFRILVIGWDKDEKAEEMCKEAFQEKNIVFAFYKHHIEGGIGFKGLPYMIAYFWFAYNILKKHENEIEFVHACDLDTGIPAFKFCKKFNKKLVYDIYDYYIDTHYVPHIIKNLIEKQEIKVINFSFTTIICTEERKIQIEKATPKNVVVIHNSPDITGVLFSDEDCDYAYCGAISEMRLLEDIFSEYQNNEDIRIKVAGSGRLEKQAKNLAITYKKFDYLGPVPYSKVLEIEAKARVLSAIYEPTIRNHQLCAPNKFYESLALGKPIIVCRGTGIDKIVEKYKVGAVINYDVEEFYEAIRTLILNNELRKDMGSRARALYEEKYKWSIMAKRLTEIYLQ